MHYTVILNTDLNVKYTVEIFCILLPYVLKFFETDLIFVFLVNK